MLGLSLYSAGGAKSGEARRRLASAERLAFACLSLICLGASEHGGVDPKSADPARRAPAQVSALATQDQLSIDPNDYRTRASRFIQAPDSVALAEARTMLAAAHELESSDPSACLDLLSGVNLAEAERHLSPEMKRRRRAVVEQLAAAPPLANARIATADEETAALSDASIFLSEQRGGGLDAFVQQANQGDERMMCRLREALLDHMIEDDPEIAAATIRRIYAVALAIGRP